VANTKRRKGKQEVDVGRNRTRVERARGQTSTEKH